MLQAIAKDPNYADAHFNLAVILITTQPSSRELAREHYARATGARARNQVRLWKDCCSDRKIELQLIL
jgi:Tfp pilus assembly protein PilF